jgi:uncharacterized membrane protein YbaN (DUF454 family)
MVPMPNQLKRRLFIIAGTIALGLGVIGIILPVLQQHLSYCWQQFAT